MVKLKVQSDTSVAVREFIIQRRWVQTASFTTIATLPYQGLKTWFFNDVSANVYQRSFVYRIISVDSCYRNDTSNIGQSILLIGIGIILILMAFAGVFVHALLRIISRK